MGGAFAVDAFAAACFAVAGLAAGLAVLAGAVAEGADVAADSCGATLPIASSPGPAVAPDLAGSSALAGASGAGMSAGFGFIRPSRPARTSEAAFSIGLSALRMSAAGFSLRALSIVDFTSSRSASFKASSNCLRKSPAILRSCDDVLPNWRSMRGKSFGPTTTIRTTAITSISGQPISNMAQIPARQLCGTRARIRTCWPFPSAWRRFRRCGARRCEPSPPRPRPTYPS